MAFEKIIQKPKNYKNYTILNDPYPTLYLNYTNTPFSVPVQLSRDEWDEFKVEDKGDYLVVTLKREED